MTVREARPREAEAILALWEAAGAVPSLTDESRFVLSAIASPHCAFLVAEEGETLGGSLIAAWDGWRGHIHKLAVLPEWRRRGVARALLAAGEEQLRRFGGLRAEAIVNVASPFATGFWGTTGWEERGDQRRFTRTLT